jgi:Lhr-like helicase
MSFKRKVKNVSVPTHNQWIKSNPGLVGTTHEIILVLRNKEWRTFTFFTNSFKFNLKLDSDEEFEETYNEFQKAFRRGYVRANLKDDSVLEERTYECCIDIESIPEDKGGRRYEIDKSRYTIQPSKETKE